MKMDMNYGMQESYARNHFAQVGVMINIGKNIRNTIALNGGTMPEDLPTPNKSLKELDNKINKKDIN